MTHNTIHKSIVLCVMGSICIPVFFPRESLHKWNKLTKHQLDCHESAALLFFSHEQHYVQHVIGHFFLSCFFFWFLRGKSRTKKNTRGRLSSEGCIVFLPHKGNIMCSIFFLAWVLLFDFFARKHIQKKLPNTSQIVIGGLRIWFFP